MKTLVVNIFGVPGAGKSTGAAYVFSRLKMAGVNAELVTEFAKDKVWEHNNEPFSNQAYIFGQQSYRMSRCDGKVDVIVTDSPLLLSILYNKDSRLTENFNQSVLDVFNSYRNLNFFLRRVKPYNPTGRLQTEEESDALAEPLLSLLDSRGITFHETYGSEEGYDFIVQEALKAVEDTEKAVLEISAEDAIWLRGVVCNENACVECPIHDAFSSQDCSYKMEADPCGALTVMVN